MEMWIEDLLQEPLTYLLNQVNAYTDLMVNVEEEAKRRWYGREMLNLLETREMKKGRK
jgi:hypothetical protein